MKKVLSVLSKKEVVLSALLTLLLVANALEFNVPLVKSVPACNHQDKVKLSPLSLPNAAVVSAGKINSTQFQDVVTLNDLEHCLVLSASNNSKVYVADAFPFT